MTSFQFTMLTIVIILFAMMNGGFFTTIDYRIRNDLPLLTKDCYCPTCGHRLTVFEQLPLIGWISLGGRCRYCKTRIPARYPILESAFVLYYLGTFLLFQKTPLLFLIAWFVFITVLMTVRSHGHYRSLAKGIAIMHGYHILIGILLWIIYHS